MATLINSSIPPRRLLAALVTLVAALSLTAGLVATPNASARDNAPGEGAGRAGCDLGVLASEYAGLIAPHGTWVTLVRIVVHEDGTEEVVSVEFYRCRDGRWEQTREQPTRPVKRKHRFKVAVPPGTPPSHYGHSGTR